MRVNTHHVHRIEIIAQQLLHVKNKTLVLFLFLLNI